MKKYLGLVLFLACFWIHSAEAATRTFVGDGASHNWSATGAWVEGIVPTAADDVVFSSNTVGSILVIDGASGSPSLCKSIDTTNYTRTITMGASTQLNVGGSTSGAFKLVAGATFVPNNTSLIKFVSTTTGNNITTGGYALTQVTFDGVGGGWQMQDSWNNGANGFITLTNGSLDTNNQTVGSSNGTQFLSNNSNTRSLTLGTTTWKLTNTFIDAWDITTPTGMTLSAASSTITNSLQTNGSGIQFNGGGLVYGTLTSTTQTTGVTVLSGANTFSALTLSMAGTTKTTTSGYVFPAGVTTTVTGTFTAAGNSLILRNFLYSSTLGTAATISAGTFAITNTDLRDITKAGAGSGDISATSATTGNGNCGGNTGWTFQAPRSVYMKTAVSVNWSAGNWFTASGGSTAATPPLPLCHDTAIFDANSVTAGSKTITNDQPRISGFNWTGVANTPAFAIGSSAFELYGSWITVAGMTNTGTANIHFAGRGSANTINAGIAPPANNMTFDAGSGTYTLATNFSNAGSSWAHTSGTLNFGGFTLTAAAAPTLTSGSWVGPGNYNAFTIPSTSAGTTGYAWSQ